MGSPSFYIIIKKHCHVLLTDAYIILEPGKVSFILLRCDKFWTDRLFYIIQINIWVVFQCNALQTHSNRTIHLCEIRKFESYSIDMLNSWTLCGAAAGSQNCF